MPEKCPACERVVNAVLVFKPAALNSPAGSYRQCPACGELLGPVMLPAAAPAAAGGGR